MSIPQDMAEVLIKTLIPKLWKECPKVQLEIIQTNKSPDLLTERYDLAVLFSRHEVIGSFNMSIVDSII